MAYTEQDRRDLKNALRTIQSCANSGNDALAALLQQIVDILGNQKDYEIVCLSNDGGDTVVKGVQVFDMEAVPPDFSIYYQGVDVTDTYDVVKCNTDCEPLTSQGTLSSWDQIIN